MTYYVTKQITTRAKLQEYMPSKQLSQRVLQLRGWLTGMCHLAQDQIRG